jgi:hypothetical protein
MCGDVKYIQQNINTTGFSWKNLPISMLLSAGWHDCSPEDNPEIPSTFQ